ncbi:MAG: a-factor receptor [Thelocarpon impressellum]|nr:MAG: a-factor receptor [Thelocarpon impressellum]
MGVSFRPVYGKSSEAVLLPVLAFLSIVLTVPPFAWHLKNRNVAACSLIFWVTLANVFVFVNALIWPTDDVLRWWSGVGLCDVEVKLTWACSVGASGALAGIMSNLAKVMDVDRATIIPSKSQRKRQMIVDVLWCYACPLYIVAVDYVVQTNRYYIFTVSGCTPAVDSSWLTIVLIFIWAPILCVIDSYYCVLVILRLRKYRKQFSQILSSSNSGLNKSRFLRLFLISVVLLAVLLPLQFYILKLNLSYPRHSYSWSKVHGPGWGDIIKVPTGGQVAFDRWIRVACGFLLFAFFGVGRDAVEMYRKWLVACGFANIFPSLTEPRRGQRLPSGSSCGTFGSLGSRAKLMLRKRSQVTTTQMTIVTTSQPSPRSSTSTQAATPSPSDPQKTFTRATPASEAAAADRPTPPSASRLWGPFPPYFCRSGAASDGSGSRWATDEEMQARSVLSNVTSGAAERRGAVAQVPRGRGVRVEVEVERRTSSRQ